MKSDLFQEGKQVLCAIKKIPRLPIVIAQGNCNNFAKVVEGLDWKFQELLIQIRLRTFFFSRKKEEKRWLIACYKGKVYLTEQPTLIYYIFTFSPYSHKLKT